MARKYEGFEDVKIVKKCEDLENSIKAENDCKSFDFKDENFLESVDHDVLYIDDSILIEGQIKEEDEVKFSSEPKLESSNAPPDCFIDNPRPLNEQISLPLTNADELGFYETFMISKEKSTPKDTKIIPNIENIEEIGSSSIIVEELEDGNILIFITQQIFENGERKSLEILSLITKDLKLIHERQIKRFCNRKKTTEQSIHIIATTDKGLTLLKSTSNDENVEHWRGNVNWTHHGDFLSRGASVLLLRKLVLEKFIGCIQSYCCDIEGEFMLSQHVFHKPEQSLVSEKYEKVQRVDQLLIFDNGKIHKIASFLSSGTGRMLKQMYSFHPHQLHINPIAESKKLNKKMSENWQEDLQLMSTYFEFKAKRKEELRLKFESPCVKSALRDYIECLIKCKPKSVMNYTLEFIKKLEQSTSADILKTFDRRQHQQF